MALARYEAAHALGVRELARLDVLWWVEATREAEAAIAADAEATADLVSALEDLGLEPGRGAVRIGRRLAHLVANPTDPARGRRSGWSTSTRSRTLTLTGPTDPMPTEKAPGR